MGHYRCGSHFLHDHILETYPQQQAYGLSEITTIDQVADIQKSDRYPVAIFNSIGSKLGLISAQGQRIIQQWHIIRLTRHNKISHFISHYFWSMNKKPPDDAPFVVEFGHNNTGHDVYARFVQRAPVYMPIQNVLTWLQEQMIINYLPYHAAVDYDQLHGYSENVKWTPNQYQDIGLEHLFTNHEEIRDLLSNFTSIVYP